MLMTIERCNFPTFDIIQVQKHFHFIDIILLPGWNKYQEKAC